MTASPSRDEEFQIELAKRQLVEGTGKRIRHAKMKSAGDIDASALRALLKAALTLTKD